MISFLVLQHFWFFLTNINLDIQLVDLKIKWVMLICCQDKLNFNLILFSTPSYELFIEVYCACWYECVSVPAYVCGGGGDAKQLFLSSFVNSILGIRIFLTQVIENNPNGHKQKEVYYLLIKNIKDRTGFRYGLWVQTRFSISSSLVQLSSVYWLYSWATCVRMLAAEAPVTNFHVQVQWSRVLPESAKPQYNIYCTILALTV